MVKIIQQKNERRVKWEEQEEDRPDLIGVAEAGMVAVGPEEGIVSAVDHQVTEQVQVQGHFAALHSVQDVHSITDRDITVPQYTITVEGIVEE